PAWPFVTLAAVLVVVFGVGASLGVRHFLVPEPEPIATSDITAPTAKPDPPGEPTAIEIQIITPGEGTDPGMVRVTWEPPEGVTRDDHYRCAGRTCRPTTRTSSGSGGTCTAATRSRSRSRRSCPSSA